MLQLDQIIPDRFCLSCKGCCRFEGPHSVWVVHLAHPDRQGLGIDGPVLPLAKQGADSTYACNFLEPETNLCSVYYKRPFECRLYPFLFNRQGLTVFLALDMHCPYAGENYETQRMEEYISYLGRICNSPEVIGLLHKNPQLIQQYQDVLNLVPIPI